MDTLDIAFAEARRYLNSLDTRPVASRGTADEIRLPLPAQFPERGMPANDVVRAIAAAAEPGLTGNAGGRFFAWVKGGALPSALAADIMCSAWDQNAVLASTSPAGAVLEEVAGRFLLDALRLPADASYAFVTGCQMAHTTALAAARHAVLEQKGWDVEAKGLQGAPVIRVLANAHHHSSVTRALRLLGLGSDCIVPLGGGGPGCVAPEALRAALAEAPMLMLPRAISPAYSDAMTAACHAAGFTPRVVREVGSAMAQLGFVAAGLGVALVSEGMARLNPPGVAFRILAGPIRGVGVALAWNAERENEATSLALEIADAQFGPSALARGARLL
jgi:hypothetical protein